MRLLGFNQYGIRPGDDWKTNLIWEAIRLSFISAVVSTVDPWGSFCHPSFICIQHTCSNRRLGQSKRRIAKCGRKFPRWCGLDIHRQWSKRLDNIEPAVNCIGFQMQGSNEEQFAIGMSELVSMFSLRCSESWEDASLKSVTLNTAKGRVPVARWAAALRVSAANRLGFIGESWLDDNALLMSRLRGTRGQTGWTSSSQQESAVIGKVCEVNTDCKKKKSLFVRPQLEILQRIDFIYFLSHAHSSNKNARIIIILIYWLMWQSGQCLTGRWPHRSAGVNLELLITPRADC